MKLSEYINMLQEYSKTADDLEVCITENGYYSDGPFADLYDLPEVETIVTKAANRVFKEGVGWTTLEPEYVNTFIVLGNSTQNY